MGSFMGHVVPGTFFTGFAMWWLYNIFFRYFYAQRFRPTSYKNTSSFTCACANHYPIESLIKVIAVVIGIVGEFVTGFKYGHWAYWGNAQHMTMFFFFGLNGIVDILKYRKWELPPKLDYLSAALAFSVEGFLFYNHLMGRSMLDVMMHMFLFYTIVACVVTTLLEMQYSENVTVALSRCFFTLLQGSWFFQIGFVLHPPIGDKWAEEDHEQMMIVTMIYAWHMAALLITMGGLGTLIYIRVQNLKGSLVSYQMVETNDGSFASEKHLIHSNGHVKSSSVSHQMLDIDSESEDA